jgi:hypothetical protein
MSQQREASAVHAVAVGAGTVREVNGGWRTADGDEFGADRDIPLTSDPCPRGRGKVDMGTRADILLVTVRRPPSAVHPLS